MLRVTMEFRDLHPKRLASGLFDDEPDMAELAGDEARLESLVRQLPELVLDLYLNYRVPPETSKPTPRKKKPAGKSGKGGKGGRR